MRSKTQLLNWLLVVIALVIWVLSAARLRAETIYDNSINDLASRFNPGLLEVGDEVVLAGTGRNVTQFDFEYWGTNSASGVSFAGAVEVRTRFYVKNGHVV